MGDGDDGRLGEFLLDAFLDQLVGVHVDIGGGFIHDQELLLLDQGSG